MKKYLVLIIISLVSCSYNQDTKTIEKIDFEENLSLKEFRLKLKNYVKQSAYPNIDE